MRVSGRGYDGDKADLQFLLLWECFVCNTERQQLGLDVQDF